MIVPMKKPVARVYSGQGLFMKKLKYFTFLIVLHSSLVFSADLHIFSVTKQDNVGDKNQILGVVDEISSQYKDGRVLYSEFQFSPQKQALLKTQLENEMNQSKFLSKSLAKSNDDRFLFLAVGDYGIEVVQQASQINNLQTCYFTHQLTLGIDQLIGKVDRIILPVHSVNQEFVSHIKNSKTKLISIIGVLHRLKADELMNSYQKNKEVIPAADTYLGVILGGDAPNLEGKIQLFTPEEATKLAMFIGNRALKTKATVLVLNGPRTGRYFSATGQVDPKAHRGGAVDLVTAAFMKQLHSILPSEKIKLFDFQFDQMSYYQTVLGALLTHPGELFVPGESTSMISETVDNLPGQVTIYENGAMNSTHQAHVQSEFRAGRAGLLTKRFEIHSVQTKYLKTRDSSRTQVAKEILRLLEPNHATKPND